MNINKPKSEILGADWRAYKAGSPEKFQELAEKYPEVVAFAESAVEDLRREEAEKKHFKRLATYDKLTGLHNYRAGEERLALEVARAHRFRHPVSFMVLDLDEFKPVNDTYGHAAGDDVLQASALYFLENVREADEVFRWKEGDEFAFIFPETHPEGALEAATKIKSNINRLQLPAEDMKITYSMGIASYAWKPGDTRTPGLIVQTIRDEADEALYFVKKNGRNGVSLYGSSQLW